MKNNQFQGQTATITGDDAHHITRVMRMEPSDQIIVCDEDKVCYLSTVEQIDGQVVKVKLDSKLVAQTELPIEVTIAQGLPKGDKFEWVIQKATECGASQFIPLSMERSVVKLDEKKSLKKSSGGIKLPRKQRSSHTARWYLKFNRFIH